MGIVGIGIFGIRKVPSRAGLPAALKARSTVDSHAFRPLGTALDYPTRGDAASGGTFHRGRRFVVFARLAL